VAGGSGLAIIHLIDSNVSIPIGPHTKVFLTLAPYKWGTFVQNVLDIDNSKSRKVGKVGKSRDTSLFYVSSCFARIWWKR